MLDLIPKATNDEAVRDVERQLLNHREQLIDAKRVAKTVGERLGQLEQVIVSFLQRLRALADCDEHHEMATIVKKLKVFS